MHKKWYQRSANRWGIGAGLGGVFLVFAVVTLFGNAGVQVDLKHVTIAETRRASFQTSLSLSAMVIPARTIYLDVVDGGRVESIYVESGTQVGEGDTLVRLTNAALMLDVIDREAQLTEQRNNLRNTRLDMERNTLALRNELLDADLRLAEANREYDVQRRMYERQQVSELVYNSARDRHDYCRARRQLAVDALARDSVFRSMQVAAMDGSVNRIEANLAIVRRNLDNLTVRAPASGLLTSLDAEIGESKSPGERIGQIDIVDEFKLSAEVDEYYLARVAPGQTAAFELSDRHYTAVVSKVYPQVRDGRFRVELSFDAATPAGARRGQTVHLQLGLSAADEALLLPRGAFHQTTAGQWVFVVGADGRHAVRRPIRLGRQNPDNFEVVDGLEEGERVIISSYRAFADATELTLTSN